MREHTLRIHFLNAGDRPVIFPSVNSTGAGGKQGAAPLPGSRSRCRAETSISPAWRTSGPFWCRHHARCSSSSWDHRPRPDRRQTAGRSAGDQVRASLFKAYGYLVMKKGGGDGFSAAFFVSVLCAGGIKQGTPGTAALQRKGAAPGHKSVSTMIPVSRSRLSRIPVMLSAGIGTLYVNQHASL